MADEVIGWDDLDNDPPAPTPDPDPDPLIDESMARVDDNGDPIIPESGLQQSLPDDDDDDLFNQDPRPGPKDDDEDAAPPQTPKPDDDNDDTDKQDPGTEDQSGIELYLSQFDIEGGMINFEDGTSKHYDDLDPEKQAEILQQLHDNQASTIEEKYGLADDEVGLINYLRENKVTVSEMVESMAKERVETLLTLQQSETTNFDEMADEAVYTKFLKTSNPEDSPEDIETKLEEAKKLSTFKSISSALRTQYKGEQAAKLSEASEVQKQKEADELESQRETVVKAVVNIKDVAGVQLNDNIKNSVLDRVLNVDDSGDSLFMSEVFGNPEKLFKAAFWYYYGDNISKQRDEYWKKEKSAAYKRGKSDALGSSSPGRSFTSSTKPRSSQGPISKKKTETDFDFED